LRIEGKCHIVPTSGQAVAGLSVNLLAQGMFSDVAELAV